MSGSGSREPSVRTVPVRVPHHAYPVHIGSGIVPALGTLPKMPELLAKRRVFVIADQTVQRLHGDALDAGLAAAGARVLGRFAMRPGEAHKDLDTLSACWDALLSAGVERRDLVVAFGGGVVGDVAGFAAATCLRGVPFVQVPTTLLAMVDSSVGGKTGIDHPRGKNLIGAFHQPEAVAADLDLLRTLPERELLSGLAEVVKAGLLGEPELFALLEREGVGMLRDPALLSDAVARAVAFKAAVVAEDEREAGKRAVLNLGHTLGHAVEVTAGYGTWTHGEAVALGIAFACRLSARLGLLEETVAARVIRCLEGLGYKIQVSGLEVEKILESLRFDKKSRGGAPRWVLLRDIGDPQWDVPVPTETVAALLRESEARSWH